MHQSICSHSFVILAYGESPFLEECVISLLNQTIKSTIVIATSTPNPYISEISKRYSLKLLVNPNRKGIASDFNFGLECTSSSLVTLAHQDDIYDANYLSEVLKSYDRNENTIIFFTDYYEIRHQSNVYVNLNLIVKRLLLLPLRFNILRNSVFIRRRILSLGSAISCPTVTFVMEKVPRLLFDSNFKVSLDWNAWEKLSKLTGKFVYIHRPLMGHRIHEDSETSVQIRNKTRAQEDLIILMRFWPKGLAKIIHGFYLWSLKSNRL